ncbi:hypothetical protein B0G85_2032 [Polynucleobacter brandtiae]|uniref:Uncharacterized protein n=1 Tax=Polynucleobacter brandtiae TaxID=1938816 RepID=A0A2M8VHE9_9BURK|nr:hypothetical protein B0G85_2032 [Polynucleobacter brandtiae]
MKDKNTPSLKSLLISAQAKGKLILPKRSQRLHRKPIKFIVL